MIEARVNCMYTFHETHLQRMYVIINNITKKIKKDVHIVQSSSSSNENNNHKTIRQHKLIDIFILIFIWSITHVF